MNERSNIPVAALEALHRTDIEQRNTIGIQRATIQALKAKVSRLTLERRAMVKQLNERDRIIQMFYREVHAHAVMESESAARWRCV